MMTQSDNLEGDELADGESSHLSMHQKPNDFLSKPFADFTAFQQVQIQKAKLQFLKKCRQIRRPPTYLRVKGASALAP